MQVQSTGASGELGYAAVKSKDIGTPTPKVQELKMPHKGSVDKTV